MPRGRERRCQPHRQLCGWSGLEKDHRPWERRASRPMGIRCLHCVRWSPCGLIPSVPKRRKFQIISKFLEKSIYILLFSHASTSYVFFLTSLGSSCLPCPSCSLPAEDMATGGPCALGRCGCLGACLSRCPDVSWGLGGTGRCGPGLCLALQTPCCRALHFFWPAAVLLKS